MFMWALLCLIFIWRKKVKKVDYKECLKRLRESSELCGDFRLKKIPEGVRGLEPRTLLRMENDIKEKRPKLFDKDAASLTPAELRKRVGTYQTSYNARQKITITDTQLLANGKEIFVRRYTPEKKVADAGIIFFFHGGGFFSGAARLMEKPCQALADYSDMEVVSVEYGLAPENPYPEGLLDCYSVVRTIFLDQENWQFNREKLFVAGDSAGGCLAIATSLLDEKLGTGMVKGIMTVYPTVNREINPIDFAKRIHEYAVIPEQKAHIEKYFTNFIGTNEQVTNWYVPSGTDSKNEFISPLLAPSLRKLPAIFMAVAEFDPLRMEEEDFAARLKTENVPVTLLRYDGMIHGFMDKLGLFPQAEDVIREMAEFTKR